MKALLNLPTKIYAAVDAHKEIGVLVEEKKKVLIVSDMGLASTPVPGMITSVLDESGISYEIYTDVAPNPDEETVLTICDYIRTEGIDQIIALGGGSPLDAAKAAGALAPNPGTLSEYQWEGRKFENDSIPLIAVPTTAGTGSEVTGVAVISSRNMKKGVLGKAIFPETALIDPRLMTGLPPFLTAITGLDALTHAIEAYIGLSSNPLTDSLAREAIKLIRTYLPEAFKDGENLEARKNMALASTMAGIAMDQAGLGIVHSLASPVCGYLHLSHGFANALLLSFGMEFNLSARPGKMAEIAEYMGADISAMDEQAAARQSVVEIKRIVSVLGLDDEISKVRSETVDTAEYGENASRMFLIKNNPRPADAVDCKNIFDTIFK